MRATDIIDIVREAQAGSQFSRVLNGVHHKKAGQPVFLKSVRSLTSQEIEALEKDGNRCADWSKVQVTGLTPGRIGRCTFVGEVLLGEFKGEVLLAPGLSMPTGVYDSVLSECEIGTDAYVRDVRLLHKTIVRERAILVDVGQITCRGKCTYGNGREISVAIETGGREVKTYAEINLELAAKIASHRGEKELLSKYAELIERYVERIVSDYTLVDEGARILHTPVVLDAYIGSYAKIVGATRVENVTILSNADEPVEISDGALVRHSIIQWGSDVTSMAIVDKSVLTEHTHVERHGKVTDSIIGANTGIAEGEVTASLVGPFVGFHHQSLLIAAFWPEGKGNVGYGANVGSNHTSKAPDQEIWPGEGTFFGLGVNIKFPSDFTESPYTIFASGVNTLPQKVSFPFSLINAPADRLTGISPAYNEIIPAWVLSDNIYTVKRNEGKYKKRNKARRSQLDFEVFRPQIVDMMKSARERLQAVMAAKEVYTDKEIKGLGKNFLLEANRKSAIETYTFYIQYYALTGLKHQIEKLIKGGRADEMAKLLEAPSGDPRWEHEREILQGEFKGADLSAHLRRLLEMQEKVAHDTQESKEKDDVRGARIIADYAQAHPPAATDGFVMETWKLTKQIREETLLLLEDIKQTKAVGAKG